MQVILASASPRRVEMMRNLGIDCRIMPADVDETVEPGSLPPRVVQDLARDKARKIASLVKDEGGEAIIVAADTVVASGEILGKPSSVEDAVSALMQMSGKSHKVYTGVCLIRLDEGNVAEERLFVDETTVHFREIDLSEARAYVATGEPADKAGSYALQGIGAFLVKGIEGCPANVKGLPVPLLVGHLRQMGLTVMGL